MRSFRSPDMGNRRKGILVRRHDQARRRIERPGNCSNGMNPCHSKSPDEPSTGKSPNQPLRMGSFPPRGIRCSIHIGIDKFEPGPGNRARAAVNSCQFLRGRYRGTGIERSPARRRPSEAQPVAPMPASRGPCRVTTRELDGLRPFTRISSRSPRLLGLAAKLVAAGPVVHAFGIEVLHVELQVGDAPGDPVVMPDNQAGRSRQADAGDIQTRRLQVRHVPDARHGVLEVHVIGQDRLA